MVFLDECYVDSRFLYTGFCYGISAPSTTTRKLKKPNGIIDVLTQNLLVYTDGLNQSAKRLVYTDEIFLSVYINGFADEIYSLSGNMQRRGDVR